MTEMNEPPDTKTLYNTKCDALWLIVHGIQYLDETAYGKETLEPVVHEQTTREIAAASAAYHALSHMLDRLG